MKRGNTAAASNYVGPLGELVVDTGEKTLRLQDGSTPGGMSTLVNSEQLANVINVVEGLSSTTANVEAILANIHGANISGLSSNISILQTLISGNVGNITLGDGNLVLTTYPDGSGNLNAWVTTTNENTGIYMAPGAYEQFAELFLPADTSTEIGYVGAAGIGGFQVYGYNGDYQINLVDNVTISANSSSWIFDGSGVLQTPGDINIIGNLSLTGGVIRGGNLIVTDNNDTITAITLGTSTYVTFTNSVFNYPVRGQATISNVSTTTQAIGTWYYEATDNSQIALFTDNTFSTEVDSTSWTPYTSTDGLITITQDFTGESVTIDANGFYTTFNQFGELQLPTASGLEGQPKYSIVQTPFNSDLKLQIGSSTTFTLGEGGNLTLPSTTGRLLFPYNGNSNALIDYTQDIGQFFILQNNFVDGYQSINLDTDDAQVTISSKNAGGYPLRTWNFDWQGQMHFPDNTVQTTAWPGYVSSLVNGTANIQLAANGTVTMPDGVTYNNATFKSQPGQALTLENSTSTQTVSVNDVFAVITANGHSWAFNSDAGLIYPDHTYQYTAYQGPAGQTDFATQANLTASNIAWQANAVTQQGLIKTLQGQVYTNANVAAYLPTYGGNISVGNITFGNNPFRVVNAPSTLYGAVGDQTNDIAFSNNSLYYCTGSYSPVQIQYSASGDYSPGNFLSNPQQAVVLTGVPSSQWTAIRTAANIFVKSNVSGAITSLTFYADNGSGIFGFNESTAHGSGYTYWYQNPQWVQLPWNATNYSNSNVSSYLTSGNITTGNILPQANVTYSLGSATQQWKSLYVSGNTIYIDGQPLSVSAGQLLLNGTAVGSGVYGNTNVAAYLAGNVTNGNLVSTTVTATTFKANNFVFANGVSILSGISAGSGTYSNVNLAAYLSGNISTGNIGLSNGSWLDFRTTDQNWRIGYSLGAYTKTTAQTTVDVVVGSGTAGPDGFTVGQTNGTSIFELVGYTKNAWFANNVTTVGNVTAGNLITSNITTTGAYGNISGANVISANTVTVSNGIFWANGTAWSSAGGTTYSNVNTAAYIAATTFSAISSSVLNSVGQINGTAVYIQTSGAHNFYFDNTGNLVLPTGGAINYANGQSILSGISAGGTIYSNSNVAAYLTTQTFYSNANVAAYLVANPQGSTYSNANVIANLQNLTTTVVTTANVQAGYFVGNGAALIGLNYASIGNIYGASSNVSLQAGTYSWTFDNTGNLSIPTNGNIIWANGTVFSSGSGSSGVSSTYSNANVVSLLSANSVVTIGNVNPYPLQSNITQVFIGNSTTLTSGGFTNAGTTYLMDNTYFAANGATYARNTQTGAYVLSMGGSTGFSFSGTTGALTANTYQAYGSYAQLNSSGFVTYNGIGITSAGALGVNSTSGITTTQTSFSIVNATATTINFGGAATALFMGAPSGTVTVAGNLFAGNNLGVSTGNLTLRAQGTWNVLTIYGAAGGYNSPPYNNQSLTGGSGTGMIASYSSTGGYPNTITVTNPGTGYKNGDILTLPGGLGATVILSQYNAYTNGGGASSWTFAMDGNLILPTVANILYANGVNILSTPTLTYGNTQANALLSSGNVSTITVTGNVIANSVIASGSSGPQTRFLWDTWQANSNVAVSSFTPSGTVGGNATWDATQAYGLKLTPAVGSQSGYIGWNSITINYNYDMIITASLGAGGGTGADGQWIYFGSSAAITGNPGNTNTYGGIAVMNHYYSGANQFEIYVNSTQTNIPFIGNAYAPSGIVVWNNAYNNFYNLTLKIRKIQNGARMLEVYLNEVYQGSANIGSWTPSGNYFGVAAYTGGSSANNWVRQLKIDW